MSKDKKARKASEAQKIALEKQLVKEGKIFPRTRYAPKGFVGRILAVLLAFLMGIFFALGGLLGAGFYLGSRPMREAFSLFGFDYSGILTDTAADMSALQLVQELAGGGIESLGDVAEYTPYVDTLISSLNEQLSALGVSMNGDELKATPFTGLGEYFAATIRSTELGGVLGVDASSDPLMLALCYGVEGSNEDGGDYTVDENGAIVMNDGKAATTISSLTEDASGILGKVTVESALSVSASSNSAMRYLAYGTEHVNYLIATGEDGTLSVEMLLDPLTGKKYRKKLLNDLTGSENLMGDATISDMVNIDENATGLLAAIRDWTIDDLKNQARLERLRLSQVITIDENSSSILKAMSGWRISDMTDQEKIDSLTLKDVISAGSSKLLQALADTRLGDLAAATDELNLSEILDDSAFTDNALLENLKNSSLSTLASDVKSLTIEQVYGDQIYSYLDLSDTDTEGSGAPKTYKWYLDNYDPTDAEKQNSYYRPVGISPDEDTFELTERRVLTANNDTQVLQGWFVLSEGSPAGLPVDESTKKVCRTADGAFIRVEVSITAAVRQWHYVDYSANAALAPLPEGVQVGTDTTGYTVEETNLTGNPVTEGDKNLYYMTERTVLAADGTQTVQKVAYPVMEDESGYYVHARTLAEGEDYSHVSRIELEYTVTQYTYTEGGDTVTFENGNVLYGEAGAQQSLPLRTRTDDSGTAYYIEPKVSVQQAYYYYTDDTHQNVTFVQESDTEMLYSATWKEDGADKSGAVEPFLNGIWYVLFGRDAQGSSVDENGHPINKTNVSILDVAPEISHAADVINTMPLWQLWLHGIISENPYHTIEFEDTSGETQTQYTNLNQLTVSGVVRYIKQLPSISTTS